MEMHPVTTILLLIGSSAVWGLWGVIFGIPIYAILKIIIMRVYNYYRKVSKVFDEDEKTSLVPKKTVDNEEVTKN